MNRHVFIFIVDRKTPNFGGTGAYVIAKQMNTHPFVLHLHYKYDTCAVIDDIKTAPPSHFANAQGYMAYLSDMFSKKTKVKQPIHLEGGSL